MKTSKFPRKGSTNRRRLGYKESGKAKNQMGGRGPEKCIAIIRNEKMEEKSKKW